MNSKIALRFLFVFGTSALILCSLSYYLTKKRLGLKKKNNRYLFWFYLVSGLLITLGPVLYRVFRMPVESLASHFFQWLQYFLLGLFATNLFTLLAVELIDFLGKKFNPGKRIFITEGMFRGVLAGSSLTTLAGWAVVKAGPSIRPIEIKLKTLPSSFDGLRITQISDVHIGPILHREFLASVVEQVNSTDPDLIFITGDLVDGTVDQIKELIEPLRELKSKEGIYFCTGNHEYYAGADEWIVHLESMGIHVFKNTNKILSRNKNGVEEKLLIGGVFDYKAEQFSRIHKTDPFEAAATKVPVACKILMAHNPLSIEETAKAGFNLQLSGHTHAGQFYPFAWIVKIVLKHTEGLYEINENTQLYVNRGTGFWGPPHRLGKRSEITQITLRS